MSVRIIAGLVVLLAVASLNEAAVKLDKLIQPCSFKDPKINECLTIQGQAIIPHLLPGVREWGTPPLDPLHLPLMEMQNGGGLSLNVTDSKHRGFDKLKILSITFDPKTLDLKVKMLFPSYNLQGTYKISGRILLLPIAGSGASNITFYNCEVTNEFKCQVEERQGKKYLKVDKVINTFKGERMDINLDNLFNNKQLSDAMNRVLSENSLEAIEDLRGPMQEIYSELYKTIIGRLLSKVPLNQLFRDYE